MPLGRQQRLALGEALALVVAKRDNRSMPKSSASVVVRRSAEELFAYVADLRNEPKWHVDVASVPADTPPLPVVGASYPVKFKPFMGKSDGRFTAVEVVPGSKIVYDAELAGMKPRITYSVESHPDGARFTRSVDLVVRGPLKVMSPLMSLMVPRRNKVFVSNVKRNLES